MNRYVVDSWADEDEKNEKVKEKVKFVKLIKHDHFLKLLFFC